jgi:hypothetical protein
MKINGGCFMSPEYHLVEKMKGNHEKQEIK